MPEIAKRGKKESQSQNSPGKNLLPNFPMKIEVVPFVFTEQQLVMNENYYY